MTSSRTLSRALLAFVVAAVGAVGCTDAATAPDQASNVGLAGTSAIEGHDAAYATATRAMKIRAGVLLTGEIVPPEAPCLQQLSSRIQGNATHLGQFEGVGSTCILDVVAPDSDPPFPGPGAPPYATATFSNPLWVLTAANGDELRLRTTGATAVCRLENFAQCRVLGGHEIVGGTGRFEGATGELSSRASNEDGVGPDDFESNGWIRF